MLRFPGWRLVVSYCGVVVCLAQLLVGATAHATERLAVLELDGSSLTIDEKGVLTDAVRGQVVDSLSGAIQVMTRENMEVMLTDMGLDASCVSEGACEVETARNLGVDYVVTGNVVTMGDMMVVSLKLHETDTGQLLSSKQGQGASSFALLQSIRDPAAQLVVALTHVVPTPKVGPVPKPKKRVDATPKPKSDLPADGGATQSARDAPRKDRPLSEVQVRDCRQASLGLRQLGRCPGLHDQGRI